MNTPIALAALAGSQAYQAGALPIASLDTRLRTLIAHSSLCLIVPMIQAWYQSYEHEQRMARFGFRGYGV